LADAISREGGSDLLLPFLGGRTGGVWSVNVNC
jgi:hypothetical protein